MEIAKNLNASISTHTPLAGCDWEMIFDSVRYAHFNSHTPCGVRLKYLLENEIIARDFNSHTPCGVRLAPFPRGQMRLSFQLTHPLRGAT